MQLNMKGFPANATGGFHIHTGGKCEISEVGGHFFKTKAHDPWKGIKWISDAQGKVRTVNTTISAGLSKSDMPGHAVVFHSETGSKVACGVISSNMEPEEADMAWMSGAEMAQGFFIVLGLVCVLCCLCRLWESFKKTYRKRQGRDTSGFAQLPMVQTGMAQSDDVELTLTNKGSKEFVEVSSSDDTDEIDL